jgi:glycosyltransferase involved in cell wall biosynthesis
VTKGRDAYLPDALESYEKFFANGDVKVILIDNGSNEISKQIILDWKKKHIAFVDYLCIKENEDGGLPFLWEQIRSLKPEWVVFPGDDDLLVPHIYDKWKLAQANNPALQVFATSAEIIDSFGRSTGMKKVPGILEISNEAERLAAALHEPPFIWPCLFFKFKLIDSDVLYSRYVFDWWVGLQLLLKGEVLATNEIGLKYRVHQQQESFQSSSRRKYFEGFNMLTSFIHSSSFKIKLGEFTDSEIIEFLDKCLVLRPLYSHDEYTIPLLRELSFTVLSIKKFAHLKSNIIEKYILGSYVLTKKGDLKSIYTGCETKGQGAQSNCAIVFEKNVCRLTKGVQDLFNSQSNNRYLLSCHHSKGNSESVFIDCDGFKDLNKFEIADKILLGITMDLELKGRLSFTLTPLEKNLVIFYRRLKSIIPAMINNKMIPLRRRLVRK